MMLCPWAFKQVVIWVSACCGCDVNLVPTESVRMRATMNTTILSITIENLCQNYYWNGPYWLFHTGYCEHQAVPAVEVRRKQEQDIHPYQVDRELPRHHRCKCLCCIGVSIVLSMLSLWLLPANILIFLLSVVWCVCLRLQCISGGGYNTCNLAYPFLLWFFIVRRFCIYYVFQEEIITLAKGL